MKFTVVVEDWLRGNVNGELLNDEGKRCCIGFAGSQCGIADDELKGLGCIDNVPSAEKASSLVYWDDDSESYLDRDWVCAAYGINDDIKMDDEERMRQLRELAVANGHEFEFAHK